MQIIKDKQLIDNTWSFISDDSEISNGNITVSFSRWQQQQDQLKAHEGQIGVRLSSTDTVEQLNSLNDVPLVELDFPAFTDGRLFSHARILRHQGYQGEIRAVGRYHADQVFYLSRVGVNAFQLDEKQLPVALKALNSFTVKYQASSN